MPEEKLTREKMIELFDDCQNKLDLLQERKQEASYARSRETDALNAYERAKKSWNEANEKFNKELNK